MLSGVRHYSHVLESLIVKRLPYSFDLPINHSGRCHHVCAGVGMAYRDLSKLWKRFIIVYSPIIDEPAVSVGGVLTHADVSEDNQFVTELCFQITVRSLDHPVRVICGRSDFVLDCWKAE